MADSNNIENCDETKVCTKCSDVFPATLAFFGPAKNQRLAAWCRQCHRLARRAYRKTERGVAVESASRRRPAVAEKIREYRKRYNRENSEALKAKRQAPQVLARSRAYGRARSIAKGEELRRKAREYNRKPENKERAKARVRARLPEVRAYMRTYLRKRWRNEMWARLATLLAQSLRIALIRGNRVKAGWWEIHCGYTVADLRRHLESRFTPEMAWENYGVVWEIDHIEPVSKFRIASVLSPDLQRLWGLSNLQPLLKHLNREKSAKLDHDSV